MHYLDFAQNFNSLGEPAGLENFLASEIKRIFIYPDYRQEMLIKSLAKSFHLPEKSIAVGNGATEILFILPQALKKGKILIVVPTFWEYLFANQRQPGNRLSFYALPEKSGFNIDFQELGKKIKGAVAVYLCNPNNPTSTLADKKKLWRLIKYNPKTDFIIDETYLIFRSDYQKQSLLRMADSVKNLYVVSSLSKIFSVPGLRIGFLSAHQDNIKKYKSLTIPYLANPLVEVAVPRLLAKKNYLKKTRDYYSRQKVKVYNILSRQFKNKLKVFNPEANFMLIKILTKNNSTDIVSQLKKHDIIIRDGAEFKELGKKWLRVAIKTDEENNKLVKTLNKIIR